MRHLKVFYLVFFSLFWLFSCQENNQNRKSDLEKTKIESKYESLQDYTWLSDFQNFYTDGYQTKFNQLINENTEANNIENIAAYYIAYGIASKQTQTIDTAYVQKAISFLEKNSTKISAEANSTLSHFIGAQYKNARLVEESNKWFENSFSDIEESDSHRQIIGLSHLLMGQNYLEQRILDQTEIHLVSALKIFEEIKDNENRGKVYLLLHTLYVRHAAFDKAETYLEKAIEIFEQEKSDFYAITAQIFYIHYRMEQMDSINAVSQIDKMANYAKDYKDISDYHKGFLNQFLTFKHIYLNNEDSALYYLNKTKEIAERTGIQDLKMRSFFIDVSYSHHFKKPLENPDEVESYFDALNNSEGNYTQQLYQLAIPLYDYYKKKGDYQKANKYVNFMFDQVNTQLTSTMKKQLFELETKYETERKEKTILLQEQKIQDKNKIIYLLIIGAIFIVFSFLIWVFWLKNKSILKEKKLTENFASQLLHNTEAERKRIASDLHDSVSNELVNLRHSLEGKDMTLKVKIDSILEEVRNISRNISPTLFDKIGLELSIEQLVERIQTQHDFFLSAEINYNKGINSEKELQLYRIIQEAITNILKHANAVAGKITIEETESSILVEVKDNGVGFDVNKMLEKGDCFGLLNITERAKYLNGQVNFHSDENGTIVNITIPKK